MTNLIDILISAGWAGAGASVIRGAGRDLRALGNNAAKTSIQMAATRQRTLMLNRALVTLGQDVTLGTLTVEQATQAYEFYESQLIDVGEAAPKAAKGLGGLNVSMIAITATMAGAVIAGKKLFRAIKEGAGLELVEKRFNRLAISIGTTGAALEDDLGFAVKGLVSDSEALALATDLMALGLANSHDEAVRLAGVSAELEFNMNQLAQTLTEKTTAGFDSLGIAVDGFEEKAQTLEDAGHDINEAFNLAFIEQAEEQIERVGSRAEETAGKLDIIANSWTDLLDTFKMGTAEAFGPLIDLLAESLPLNQRILEAERLVDEARERGRISAEDYRDLIILSRQSIDLYIERLFELAEGIEAIDRSVALADQKFLNFTATVKESLLPWDELLEKLGLTEEKFQELIDTANEFSIDFQGLTIGSTNFITDAVGQSITDAMEPRADIWMDFQADLTDISEREGERRAEVEGRHEERRTDIVDKSGERRTKLEKQSALRLDRIREDSADRQAQIRETGNQRLSDLERDHLDRMQEIIENADLQLMDAAGRLDARAVARIKRQREDALGDETDSFKKQRKDIKRQIDGRIKAEQKAEEKRIRREEENNALRLQQMEDAHREQLTELKDKHDDELQEIKDNAIKARIERENDYIDERMQLDAHWRAKDTLDTKWMNAILIKEEQFWKSRLNLVGGGGGGKIDLTEDPKDTDDGDGETGEQKAGRLWLKNTALSLADPTNENFLYWTNKFNSMTDAQIAAWIEQNSELDVPGYKHGGRHPRSGLALLGEDGPEMAWLPGGTDIFDSSLTRQFFSKAGVNIGELNVIVNESERPGETGQEVREELEKVFRELADE